MSALGTVHADKLYRHSFVVSVKLCTDVRVRRSCSGYAYTYPIEDEGLGKDMARLLTGFKNAQDCKREPSRNF